jgi:hypothetical protein
MNGDILIAAILEDSFGKRSSKNKTGLAVYYSSLLPVLKELSISNQNTKTLLIHGKNRLALCLRRLF